MRTLIIIYIIINSYIQVLLCYSCHSTYQLCKSYERNSLLPSFLKQELTLVKSFPFGKTTTLKALDRLTVKFPEGKIVGIIGPSSSGKSTLGNLLLGRELPTHGHLVYSENVHRIPVKVDHLITSTYEESQTVAACLFDKLLDATLSQSITNLLQQANIRPNQRINELLQSEKKIVEILHACITSYRRTFPKRPDSLMPLSFLVVLDEYLDKEVSSVQRKVYDFLHFCSNLSDGETLGVRFQCFFITHSFSLAKNCCDYVISLENGRLLDEGESESFSTLRKSNQIDFL